MSHPSLGCLTLFKIIQAYKFQKYDQIRQLLRLFFLFPPDIKELETLLTNAQWIQQILTNFIQFLTKQAQKGQFDAQLVNKLIKDYLSPLKETLYFKQKILNELNYERLMVNGKLQYQKKNHQQALTIFQQAFNINQSQQATLYLILTNEQTFKYRSKKKIKSLTPQEQTYMQQLYTKLLNFEVRNQTKLELYQYIAYIQINANQNKQLIYELLKIVIDLQTKDPLIYLNFVEFSYLVFKENQLYLYVQKIEKYCLASLEKYYCLARVYYSNKEYDKVVEILLQHQYLIQKNQTNKRMASKYYNQPKKAEKYAKQISNFNQYDKYYMLLGHSLMNDKYGERIQQAFQAYSKGLRWNKQNSQIIKIIVQYFRGNDKYVAEEIEYLETALQINESKIDIEYYMYFAQVASSLGIVQQQKNVLELIDKQFITHQRFKFLAYNYFECKQYQLAQKYCLTMIEIHVDQSEAYYILGRIHLKSSQLIPARQNFLKSLQLDPKHYQSSFHLALILQIQKNYEEALLQYQKTVETNPNYSKGYQKLCKMCIKLQRKSEVISFATGLIVENQQNYKGYYYLGNIMYEQQDFTEALNYYENVLKYQANHYRSNYRIFLLHVILNNIQSAKEHYKSKMHATQQTHYEVINVLGYIQLKQGSIHAAIKLFLESLNSQCSYFEPYYHLGQIINKNDQVAQFQQIQAVIQIKQQTANELFNYSLFYLGMGCFEIFIENFSKALQFCKTQLDKDQQKGKKMLNDHMRNMIKKCSHLQKLYPQNVYFPIILGHLYRDIGDRQRSQKAFKKVLNEKKDTQSLSNYLITFYNKHLQWHVNSLNCLLFFCEYLIEEALNRSVSQGIYFYNILSKSNIQFQNHYQTKILLNKKLKQSLQTIKIQINQSQLSYKSQTTQLYALTNYQLISKALKQLQNLYNFYKQYIYLHKQIKQEFEVCKIIDQSNQEKEQEKSGSSTYADVVRLNGYIYIIIYNLYPFVKYDESTRNKLNDYLVNFNLNHTQSLKQDLAALFPKYQKSDISTDTHLSSQILFHEQPDDQLHNALLYESKQQHQQTFYTLNQNYYVPQYQNMFQKRLIKKETKQKSKSMINLQKKKASSVYFFSQILQGNQDDFNDQPQPQSQLIIKSELQATSFNYKK